MVGPITNEKRLDLSQVVTWDPSSNFIDRVRWRYPTCDEELVTRLGKVNWTRLQRCQRMKDRNTQPGAVENLSQDQAVSVATKPVSNKVASTAYHDSGIGTSIPSETSVPTASHYTETVISYSGGRGDTVRIPNLPDEAKAGLPFTCLVCGKLINITNKSAWK